MLYMFRTLSFWPWNSTVHTDLDSHTGFIPSQLMTKHQWLLLNFMVLLMMDAKSVLNMQSILVVVNKHNTARGASSWFIIYEYYRLVMHGNSNIKYCRTFTLYKYCHDHKKFTPQSLKVGAIPLGICGGQSGTVTGFVSVTSLSSVNKIPKIRNIHIAFNSQRHYVKLATDSSVK